MLFPSRFDGHLARVGWSPRGESLVPLTESPTTPTRGRV